jgi:hypothetical protein
MSELGGFGIRKGGSGGGGTGLYVRLDGTTPLTNDWNAGSYTITSNSFVSTLDSTINSVNVGKGGGNISSNTSLGNNALFSNTTGINNTALGYTALQTNIIGNENTAIGSNSLLFNVADGNTAIGAYSQRLNSTGYFNTSVGRYSLRANTIGQENTAIGYNSLQSNTSGSNNIGLGIYSLNSNETASTNTAVGSYSLEHTIAGGNNVALGYGAGRHLSDGSTPNTAPTNSLFLGANTRSLGTTNDNQIVIGYLALGKGSNTVQLGNTSITATYLQGEVNVNPVSGQISRVIINSDNNVGALLSFRTANLPRWAIRKDGNETGSNVGGDLSVRRYDDAGAFIDNPISIKRSTGVVTLNSAYDLPTTAPTIGQVLGYVSSGVSGWVTSAGGLTYFTEARSTTAPNNVTNVDSLSAGTGLSTVNVDIAIVPRANGAFLLAVPDNTTTGGNKRGTKAVDLQMERDTASKVASGAYSTITGGRWNTASGDYSLVHGFRNTVNSNYGVALGIDNNVSGSYATALGYSNISSGQNGFTGGYSNTASATGTTAIGWANTANAQYATSVGGQSNISSGSHSFTTGFTNTASGTSSIAMGASNSVSNDNSIGIGIANTATGYRSVSIGVLNNATGSTSYCFGNGNTANRTGAVAIGTSCTSAGDGAVAIGNNVNTFLQHNRISFSSGAISTAGDIQKSFYMLKGRSSSATPKTLTSDNGGITTASVIVLQNNNVFRFKGSIVGKQTGTTNIAVWDIDGVIVRGAGVATTVLTIANINLVTNAPGWGTPTLTADTTLGGLTINVVGLAGTNIQWIADVQTSEVIY